MNYQITIVGLGQIGTSIGLALKNRQDLLRRIGHDREPNVARQAEKLGALDQVSFNLPSAVRQADVVVLAIPVDEMRSTLEIIVQEIKPGCVIVDTSPVKQSVLDWISELLPENRYFVAITPTLNPAYLYEHNQGIDAAHEDLFKDGLMIITTPPGTANEAIKLASDLSSMLGSTPLFADPYEADGLFAASHMLPQLMAVALLNATADQPGWKEGRKFAGRNYAQVSTPILNLDDQQSLGNAFLLNRDNVVRVLGNAIQELQELRRDIISENKDSLQTRLENAQESRKEWWEERLAADWSNEGKIKTIAPTTAEVFGRLIGLGPKYDGRDREKGKK